MQVTDGNFPNGAFSHSFGLEMFIESKKVVDERTFCDALHHYFYLQLIPFEGLSTYLTWQRAQQSDVQGIVEIGDLVAASLLPEETRRGALQIGHRTLQMINETISESSIRVLSEFVEQRQAFVTYGMSVAVACASLGISNQEAVATVLYAEMSSLVTAAVRAVPLGQTAGQRLLAKCRTWLEDVPCYEGCCVEDVSGAALEWEIAQMNHAFLNGRLFIS